jgi:hypothetical protein
LDNLITAANDGIRKTHFRTAASGELLSAGNSRHHRPGIITPHRLHHAMGLLKNDPLKIATTLIAATEPSTAAIGTWWNPGFRQEIIGRSFARHPARFGCRRVRHLRLHALVNQPSRQRRRSIFLQPLIQEIADLLAQVGSMSKAGEFIVLQGVPRSAQQELSGRLGLVLGHGILQRNGCAR